MKENEVKSVCAPEEDHRKSGSRVAALECWEEAPQTLVKIMGFFVSLYVNLETKKPRRNGHSISSSNWCYLRWP